MGDRRRGNRRVARRRIVVYFDGMSAPESSIHGGPESAEFEALCAFLAAHADRLDQGGQWPAEQLRRCAQAGVFRWFLEERFGGWGWSEEQIARGYLRLSRACLTTAFIITQRSGACRRMADSQNTPADEQYLPALARGDIFATLGISHLTTSRRHLARPALLGREVAGGFELSGYSPWVTGARHAQVIVLGAALDDGREVLIALPTDLAGIRVEPSQRLVALAASDTGVVRFDGVRVERRFLLDGPAANVMKQGGARTGSLQTSTLALGLADAAVSFLEQESAARKALAPPGGALRREWESRRGELLALAAGATSVSAETLRAGANSLVLRATQSALAAAKGSGFVAGHPAGRWCREALFFLVWSCPQPVMAANLCEMAGLDE
jgi:alkylation response protein AidB-like acyl-CoA dehydrogenase